MTLTILTVIAIVAAAFVRVSWVLVRGKAKYK